MASLAMEIGDDDYLPLSPVEEDGDGDDYLQLSPVEEDHQQLPPEQDEEEEDDDGRVFSSPADIIPRVGVVTCAPDDSELALAVAEVLKTVDESRDCPICLQDDDAATWKETPCGHRFHGRCVERWLQAKGSCPMCRSQVVTMPAVAVTDADFHVLVEVYGLPHIASAFGWVTE